jgi:hypothetical protein
MENNKMNNGIIVDLKGKLSPLEDYFRNFDIGKADWTTEQYQNYATKNIPPSFLREGLKEDFKQRYKEKNNAVIYIYGNQGCQPAGSKVLMADGTIKNIEDIKIGDEILSLQYNGNTTIEKVINTTNWYCEDMYSVISKRNNKLLYKCSHNHLIPLTLDIHTTEIGKTHSTRKTMFNQINVLANPKEIMNWQTKNKTCRWQIKQGAYIQEFKNQKNCEINPYFLGVFLGGGCYRKSSLSICSPDLKIIKRITIEEQPIRISSKKDNKAKSYHFSIQNNYANQLEKLGLRNTLSGTKFIPKQALTSNAKYRLEILNGLIDTNGFVDKNGRINITTKSIKLAEDIKFLVCSLGGNSSIHKMQKKCQIKDFIGTYYEITISLGIYKKLLNLSVPFKKNRLFKEKSWDKQGIINFRIEQTKPCQVYGFGITGESQLYVTDNMVITHNSGKSLMGLELGLLLGKIFGRPLQVKNVTFFDAQFCNNLKETEHKDTLIHDEADEKDYGALMKYYSGEIQDAMFRNRATQQNYIFCSPHEGERGQFITIDVKNTRKDENGIPQQIEALLYTSWYYDSEIRVCRGILIWDISQETLGFYKKYNVNKLESLDKIKKDLGGTFDIVNIVANKKYLELKNKLIIKPQNEKEEYSILKGAYFGDIIEIEGDIGKYTRDLRQKIIRAIKVKAILEVNELNQKEVV